MLKSGLHLQLMVPADTCQLTFYFSYHDVQPETHLTVPGFQYFCDRFISRMDSSRWQRLYCGEWIPFLLVWQGRFALTTPHGHRDT